MDTPEKDTRVTRDEAARLTGYSLRTIDRLIPPGTAGRTEARPSPTKPHGVLIERALVEALLPAPGGDSVGE
jgi:hypothetical protein